MPSKEIPDISVTISERFFKAVDALVSRKCIRGLGTLAKKWDVSRFALTWSKNHPDEKRIKVEYIYYISRDYNVSLDWLFFGTGKMFTL